MSAALVTRSLENPNLSKPTPENGVLHPYPFTLYHFTNYSLKPMPFRLVMHSLLFFAISVSVLATFPNDYYDALSSAEQGSIKGDRSSSTSAMDAIYGNKISKFLGHRLTVAHESDASVRDVQQIARRDSMDGESGAMSPSKLQRRMLQQGNKESSPNQPPRDDHPTLEKQHSTGDMMTVNIIRKGLQVFGDKQASDLLETYKRLQAALEEREAFRQKQTLMAKEWKSVTDSFDYTNAAWWERPRLKSFKEMKHKDDNLKEYCAKHEELIDLAFLQTKRQLRRIILLQASDKTIRLDSSVVKQVYKHVQTPILALKTLPMMINGLVSKYIENLRTITAADRKISLLFWRHFHAEQQALLLTRIGTPSEVQQQQDEKARAASERYHDSLIRVSGMLSFARPAQIVWELAKPLQELSASCKIAKKHMLDQVNHLHLAKEPYDLKIAEDKHTTKIPPIALPYKR